MGEASRLIEEAEFAIGFGVPARRCLFEKVYGTDVVLNDTDAHIIESRQIECGRRVIRLLRHDNLILPKRDDRRRNRRGSESRDQMKT